MPSDDFTRLVDAHYASLYRFALSLTKNGPDAGDLTQQTFLIWARRGDTLRDETKAKAWLFTTLYREFLRGRRHAGRTEPLDEHETREYVQAPDATCFNGSKAGLALEALHEVDEVYRTPLTLFYLKDFSYKDIAAMLDVPIGTVMSRLARGKTQLSAAIARKQEGDQTAAGDSLPT